MTHFRKLFAACLLISCLALIISGGLAGLVSWFTEQRGQTEKLIAYGQELATTLNERQWDPDALRQVQGTINTLDRTHSARVWLLDPDGRMLMFPAASPPGRRPFVRPDEARRVLRGETVVLGQEQGPEFRGGLTVMVPAYAGSEVRGVLLLSAPPPDLPRQMWAIGVGRYFLLGSAVSAVLLAGVSYVISRRLARPISAVSAAALRLAQGDFSARVDWQSDDEVGRLARSFNEMAAELDRLERARKELLANVSHELKGPLSRMAGYLEAIHDGVGAPEARARYFEIVRRETARLGRLVNDLLDFSRLESGRVQLRLFPCDLAPNLLRATEVFQAPAAAAGVDLVADLPSSLPLVEADPERVEQILTNLLENALAHTPQGGSVTVSAGVESGRLQIAVRDTGSGIPAEELALVWERFYKVDRARTPNSGGSGLGLAIVRQLAELQQGEVFAHSQEGAGSTFGVRFRLAVPS